MDSNQESQKDPRKTKQKTLKCKTLTAEWKYSNLITPTHDTKIIISFVNILA